MARKNVQIPMQFADMKFLQDDFECAIFFVDLIYPTVEHAYQAQKIEPRKRGYERAVVRDLPTAKRAKSFGNKIKMRPSYAKIFHESERQLVTELMVAKFGQKPMKERLAQLTVDDLRVYFMEHSDSMTKQFAVLAIYKDIKEKEQA